MGKKVGEYHDVPVYVDPDLPPGHIYFINDRYLELVHIDARSRWQRIKDWFKRRFKR